MPELPEAKRQRFVDEYALATRRCSEPHGVARDWRVFRNDTYTPACDPRLAGNWIVGEFSAATQPRRHRHRRRAGIRVRNWRGIAARIADGTISGKIAKDVFDAMWAASDGDADAIIAAKGLRQISDVGAIEKIVDDVLAANAAIVAEYKAGKEKAFNSLVGKAMAATKGKANPAQVNAVLKQKLG